jgi:hypothetical protein
MSANPAFDLDAAAGFAVSVVRDRHALLRKVATERAAREAAGLIPPPPVEPWARQAVAVVRERHALLRRVATARKG